MMLGVVKQAAMDAIAASNPVTLIFGEVIKADPLEVNVDQRFTLTADFLIVPESLMKYEIDARYDHSYNEGTTGSGLQDKLLIRRGLDAGDKLILLRMQGGQRYLILDRVVKL